MSSFIQSHKQWLAYTSSWTSINLSGMHDKIRRFDGIAKTDIFKVHTILPLQKEKSCKISVHSGKYYVFFRKSYSVADWQYLAIDSG